MRKIHGIAGDIPHVVLSLLNTKLPARHLLKAPVEKGHIALIMRIETPMSID